MAGTRRKCSVPTLYDFLLLQKYKCGVWFKEMTVITEILSENNQFK